MLIKWGVVSVIFGSFNDASNCRSNCKSNFESLWRQASFTVSAKIIFIHAQKIAVAAKSVQLLFSMLSLIPLHSLCPSLSLLSLTQYLISCWRVTKTLGDCMDLRSEIKKSPYFMSRLLPCSLKIILV